VTRAAIYARYSSDNQRDASIEDQARLCRAWLEGHGHGSAEVYADRAVSGATLLRPGIQKLLEDCMAGRIDLVVAESLDRLSRDQEDMAGLYKRLSFAGIRLITLADGEVNELHVGLKGTMNQLYLKDLADKTRRGLRGRIEAGRSGGGLCYGYDVVPSGDDDRGQRRINQAKAAIVRRIFEAYAAGKSPRRIARDLNRDAVPGPSGTAWGPSTINGNSARGTGILNNELYIGRLVWNRLRYVKNPETGRRVSRPNPPEAWIVKDVPALRVIGQDLWQRVKQRQKVLTKDTRPDARGPRPFWKQTRPGHLLAGLMKCGACGGSYTKRSATLFGCATARDKGTCDNRINIRRDVLEEGILAGLKERLMDPELFKVFAKEFAREIRHLNAGRTIDREQLRQEVDRLPHQIDRLVMAIANGADALALNEKIKALETRQQELRKTLAEAANPEPLIHPNLAELYRRKVKALAHAVNDPDTRTEAFEVIRSLIDSVVLTPVDGQLQIDLRGELVGILSLCDTKGKPASQVGKRAAQIKMVAGARYQPFRTPVSAFVPIPEQMVAGARNCPNFCCTSRG